MTDYDVSSALDDPAFSPAQLDLARRLTARFRARGHELFLVGGAVRDALLGESGTELDFATSALPPDTAAILEEVTGRRPYRIGEKFGTIGSQVGDLTVEVTTYRSHELYPPHSRKPEVRFGRTLHEDLARRDFTLNALALDVATMTLIDPFHGADDLRAGVIRAVGDPEARFREDPLRLLRAIRFAGRYGFTIEPATWEAIRSHGAQLRSISRERIRDEYTLDLESERPSAALVLLRDSGLLQHSVPELLELTHMPDHGPNHPLSLWDHTMRVVDAVPPRLEVRWAAVLHDIAKPATRTHESDGRTRFFHHEVQGATVARSVLRGLRYPSQTIEAVALLVETHMQIHAYSAEWSDGAVRRLCLRLGSQLPAAIELARADAGGHSLGGVARNSPKFDALEARLAGLDAARVQELRSPLSGDELMDRYARPPGPWLRTIKDRLQNEVIDGRLESGDKEGAWRIADSLVAGGC